MSKHIWIIPEKEPPKKSDDLTLAEFIVEIIGYVYNVMIALMILLGVLVVCAITLFLITCAILIFAKFVSVISNPIPFIEQF